VEDAKTQLACPLLGGRPVSLVCSRRKGEHEQNVKNEIARGQKRREPFFLSGGKTPFFPFFLFLLFLSFSDRSINQSSINRHTFASFCGVRGSPGVSKAALNSTVLVGGVVQPSRPPDPLQTAILGREGRDWIDGGLDRTAGAQANLSLVGKHAKMFCPPPPSLISYNHHLHHLQG